MTPADELELPPWTKFSLYGMFPWKLVLHVLLLLVVTFQAFAVNILFAPYSRAMWSSVVQIYFPANYQSLRSSLTSPYQYLQFTKEQTIADGNLLFQSYFTMPDVSVNLVEVYSVGNSSVTSPPTVKLTRVDGSSQTYTVPSLAASSTEWPLGLNTSTVQSQSALRGFFREMSSLLFQFPIVSYGNNDNINTQTNVCYSWTLSFLYDLSSTGQILVTSTSDMVGRCDPLLTSSSLYVCSFVVAMLAAAYQLLILRASARRLIILHSISRSVAQAQSLASQGHREFSISDSASASVAAAAAHGCGSNVDERRVGASRRQLASFDGDDGEAEDSEGEGAGGDSEGLLRPPQRRQQRALAELTGSRGSRGNYHLVPCGGPVEGRPSPSSSSSSPLNVAGGGQGRGVSGYDNSVTSPLAANAHLGEHPNRLPLPSSSSHSSSSSSPAYPREAQQQQTPPTLEQLEDMDVAVRALRQALDSLSLSEVVSILNVWFFISTAGNIAALIYSCQVVFFRDDIATQQYIKNSLGMACLLLYFGVVQYLEFFPRYYIMISVLKRTAPRVSRFLLGVLPLFIGYALLGMVAFGDEVDRFGDVPQTLRTLFAVVNGDIIYDTFNAVDVVGWGGSVYIFIYITLFTYVVLMTIIAIVEEAFFESSGLSVLDRGRAMTDSGPASAPPDQYAPSVALHPQVHAATSIQSPHDADDDDADDDDDTSVKRSFSTASVSSAMHALHENQYVASSGGKRQLPEHLRVLLHAKETVRHIEEELDERRQQRAGSKASVDHAAPHFFFR
jgi:hypothetical protein